MNTELSNAIEEILPTVMLEVFVLLVIIVVCSLSAGDVQFDDIKNVIGSLQAISAAIFTIVGLWVGFLYPNAIASIAKDDVSYIANTGDANRIENLVVVISVSALVMLSTLFVYLLRVLLPVMPFYESISGAVKIGGVSVVIYLCWMQARCVWYVIKSNLRFVSNLHHKLSAAKLEHE
ncbi:hypothetical protein [Pontibacterium sp.]|uniref:hypothetical protein n=1 Tax=Pontibacterium sp. TaxID=2036026 RepID=UPI0035122AB2